MSQGIHPTRWVAVLLSIAFGLPGPGVGAGPSVSESDEYEASWTAPLATLVSAASGDYQLEDLLQHVAPEQRISISQDYRLESIFARDRPSTGLAETVWCLYQ